MKYALLAIASYVLGSLPFGVIVAKLRGVDIMAVGSGNTGATNVARTLGWKLGALVFVLDVAKGVVPPIVTLALTRNQDAAVLMGVAAVVGHTFSPFLRFKGGKGVATSLGVLFGAAPLVGACGFGVFLLLFLATRIVSLSSLIAAVVAVVVGALTGQGAVFIIVFGALTLYLFVRHRANIKRLLRGEEPKLELRRKDKKDDDDV